MLPSIYMPTHFRPIETHAVTVCRSKHQVQDDMLDGPKGNYSKLQRYSDPSSGYGSIPFRHIRQRRRLQASTRGDGASSSNDSTMSEGLASRSLNRSSESLLRNRIRLEERLRAKQSRTLHLKQLSLPDLSSDSKASSSCHVSPLIARAEKNRILSDDRHRRSRSEAVKIRRSYLPDTFLLVDYSAPNHNQSSKNGPKQQILKRVNLKSLLNQADTIILQKKLQNARASIPTTPKLPVRIKKHEELLTSHLPSNDAQDSQGIPSSVESIAGSVRTPPEKASGVAADALPSAAPDPSKPLIPERNGVPEDPENVKVLRPVPKLAPIRCQSALHATEHYRFKSDKGVQWDNSSPATPTTNGWQSNPLRRTSKDGLPQGDSKVTGAAGAAEVTEGLTTSGQYTTNQPPQGEELSTSDETAHQLNQMAHEMVDTMLKTCLEELQAEQESSKFRDTEKQGNKVPHPAKDHTDDHEPKTSKFLLKEIGSICQVYVADSIHKAENWYAQYCGIHFSVTTPPQKVTRRSSRRWRDNR